MGQSYLESYGPVGLVTGASSGIGWAFAEELAARGFDLVLTARRTDRMEDLAAKLKDAHGTTSRIVECDLTDPDAPAKLLKATEDIDIGLLVSNAGRHGIKDRYEALTAQHMWEMLMVNSHAAMQLAHGFIPRLKARGKGGIIFTSSCEGLMGTPYSTVYAATKALVVALGEGLWGELQGSGIDILTLCPGATATKETAHFYAKLPDFQMADECVQRTLDNIRNGPTYVPREYFVKMYEQLHALPRRKALSGMADNMKAFMATLPAVAE